MTDPKSHKLDVPGAVLHYDVRSSDSSTAPILLLIGSPMGAATRPRSATKPPIGTTRP
jgi:hypothetical protein